MKLNLSMIYQYGIEVLEYIICETSRYLIYLHCIFSWYHFKCTMRPWFDIPVLIALLPMNAHIVFIIGKNLFLACHSKNIVKKQRHYWRWSMPNYFQRDWVFTDLVLYLVNKSIFQNVNLIICFNSLFQGHNSFMS